VIKYQVKFYYYPFSQRFQSDAADQIKLYCLIDGGAVGDVTACRCDNAAGGASIGDRKHQDERSQISTWPAVGK
jgi:hypothetical protein